MRYNRKKDFEEPKSKRLGGESIQGRGVTGGTTGVPRVPKSATEWKKKEDTGVAGEMR